MVHFHHRNMMDAFSRSFAVQIYFCALLTVFAKAVRFVGSLDICYTTWSTVQLRG